MRNGIGKSNTTGSAFVKQNVGNMMPNILIFGTCNLDAMRRHFLRKSLQWLCTFDSSMVMGYCINVFMQDCAL